jgi:hypothetical protein
MVRRHRCRPGDVVQVQQRQPRKGADGGLDVARRCQIQEQGCRQVGLVPGACLGPFVCAGVDTTPAYDCRACPCPGADACYEDVCIDAATRDLERDADVVVDNLDMDEYARIFEALAAQDAIPLGEAAPAVALRLQADSRTTTLLVGADAAMDVGDLEAALGVVVDAAGFTPAARLDVRERRAQACAELAAASGAGVLPEQFVVAIVPTDAASHATCPFPGTFAHCDIPMGGDCVLRAGRLSAAVVVVDQKVVMPAMDQAMLLRAGLAPPEVLDAFLSTALTTFEGARSPFPLQDGFRIGERFVGAYLDDDLLWLVLADPNARPDKIRTFRVVWNDPPSQAYLIEHDIQARDCAFDAAAAGRIVMTCDNGGFALTATVDTGDLSLVDVRQDP